MSDDVKRALEAAVRRRVKGRRADETAWADAMQATGDDIATFLRALRTVRVLVPEEHEREWHDTRTLAAAVERAAREAE